MDYSTEQHKRTTRLSSESENTITFKQKESSPKRENAMNIHIQSTNEQNKIPKGENTKNIPEELKTSNEQNKPLSEEVNTSKKQNNPFPKSNKANGNIEGFFDDQLESSNGDKSKNLPKAPQKNASNSDKEKQNIQGYFEDQGKSEKPALYFNEKQMSWSVGAQKFNFETEIQNLQQEKWVIENYSEQSDTTLIDSIMSKISQIDELKMRKQKKTEANPLEPEINKLKTEYKENMVELLKLLGYQFQDQDWLLGEGSFGFVFRAKDKNLCQIALKIQIIDLKKANFSLNQIRNELKILNEHAKFYPLQAELSFEQKILVYKSCLIALIGSEAGISLRQIMDEKIVNDVCFSKQEKETISRDLIEHLFILHSQKIAHCDIKPENVIYRDNQKKYCFIDFGISSYFEENIMKDFRGTLLYCSPLLRKRFKQMEIVSDPFKNDIYALGVTLLQINEFPTKVDSWKKIESRKSNEFQITFKDTFSLMEEYLSKRANNTVQEVENFVEIYNEISCENPKTQFLVKYNNEKLFYRNFNIIELALEENEEERIDIYGLALLMNLRECFLVLEKKKKIQENICKIYFPQNCLHLNYYEGNALIPYFCESDMLILRNGTQIMLEDFLNRFQKKQNNFKTILEINNSLKILENLEKTGVFTLLFNDCFSWQKIGEFPRGIELVIWEGVVLNLSENYFKFLLSNTEFFSLEIYRKLKLKIKKYIPDGKVWTLMGNENFHDVKELKIVLYGPKNENGEKNNKLKIIFKPIGDAFYSNVQLQKLSAKISEFLIESCKNLEIVEVFHDFCYKIPALSVFVASQVNKIKRSDKKFQRFCFWDKNFAFSFQYGWHKWCFLLPHFFASPDTNKILPILQKSLELKQFEKIGGLNFKYIGWEQFNVPLNLRNVLASFLKILMPEISITSHGCPESLIIDYVPDEILMKCTKFTFLQRDEPIILGKLERILEKMLNLTSLTLACKADTGKKKPVSIKQNLKELKFKKFMNEPEDWKFLFENSENFKFLKKLEKLSFRNYRENMFDAFRNLQYVLPGLKSISFKELHCNDKIKIDNLKKMLLNTNKNLSKEKLRFRWLEKIDYEKFKPKPQPLESHLILEHEEFSDVFEQTNFSKILILLQKNEKIFPIVYLNEENINILKLFILQKPQYFAMIEKDEQIKIDNVLLNLKAESYNPEFFENNLQFLEDRLNIVQYKIANVSDYKTIEFCVKFDFKKNNKIIPFKNKIEAFKILKVWTDKIYDLFDMLYENRILGKDYKFEQAQIFMESDQNVSESTLLIFGMKFLLAMKPFYERNPKSLEYSIRPWFKQFIISKNTGEKIDFSAIFTEKMKTLKNKDLDLEDYMHNFCLKKEQLDLSREEFFLFVEDILRSGELFYSCTRLNVIEELENQEEKDLFGKIQNFFLSRSVKEEI